MNKTAYSFVLFFAIGTTTAAEEGMWLPRQLPSLARNLKILGLELEPRSLSDLRSYPMNAVVRLGGCSASFVSPNGLIITNYHCGKSSIQLNSSVERNLLERGFLASSQKEELPATPGLHVLVTVGFKDVTAKVLEGLGEVEGEKRSERIDARRRVMIHECEKQSDRCQVASFYGGVQYSLVRQVELRDVRLVYAPPEGIGRYGGDVDNFTWPQQKGDFAFFRAYVGADGKAADPKPDNQPYHPRHYLKVARNTLKEGDFVMVAGYPNATNRYRFSSEVEDKFLWDYPRLIESSEKWLRVEKDSIQGHPDAALKYAGFVAGLNNSLKFARGLVEGFASSGLLERKLAVENDLRVWIDADPRRKAIYGDPLGELREAFIRRRETRELERRYDLATQSSLLGTARQIYRLAREREKPDFERTPGYQERDWEAIRQALEKSGRSFDSQVDCALWRASIMDYHELPAGQRSTDFDHWFGLEPGRDAQEGVDRVLDRMYSRTRLSDIGHVLTLTRATTAEIQASTDPFLELAVRLFDSDLRAEQQDKQRSKTMRALYARYMAALVAFMESRGRVLYPDANGTLRVAFGQVKGYINSAGASFQPFTTAEDVVAKDKGIEPFDTPAAALRALREKRFGRYRDPVLATLPVNFLATVDVAGGNSGAPTLNSRGELVGLLFDLNQEGILSSWDYTSARNRSIHLDIHYVLWFLDEVEHARALLAELGVGASPKDLGRRPAGLAGVP